jgi:serine/tyrosine/threonine adenylyltransferase
VISPHYRPKPCITELGEGFADEVSPARFPQHVLRYRDQAWAERVGLASLDDVEWEAHFARFLPLPANLPRPLALRYHGHQFDVYNPQIGDGRGFLFAQLEDDRGRLLDLATKGSGTTPWSRGGDGRLTLKGGVREVLATTMLEALGVDTSVSFSLFETGEKLLRGDEPSPTRSSVLVRLGHSHLRFGTFQRVAHEASAPRMERLLAHAVARYYPELAAALEGRPLPELADRFFREVVKKAAAQCASYMVGGFVHGVLNSDNMVITGQSLDYGPYRFLPAYDLDFTAAYFDHGGLYAYGNQPRAFLRNVLRLGGALRLVAPDLPLGDAGPRFEEELAKKTHAGVVRRLGLASLAEMDEALTDAAFAFLAQNQAAGATKVGFERFFFDLHGGTSRLARAKAGPAGAAYTGPRWDELARLLELYTPARASLPAYFDGDGPCTLLIDELEALWSRIADADDWGPFEDKLLRIRARAAAELPA